MERLGIRQRQLPLSDRRRASTAADAPKLALKWAFGFPNGNSAYGQPAVVGGRVFVGADTGFVYALDAATGCIHWSFRADAGVRTAVSIGEGRRCARLPRLLRRREGERLRGRRRHRCRGVEGSRRHASRRAGHRRADARRWPSLRPDVVARGIGRRQPELSVLHVSRRRRVYDAATGKRLWTSYTIPEKAVPLKKTSKGTQLWGPAGAGVWSAPSIDLKRRVVYVATGNGYTEPAARGSDAVIAFDLDSGRRLWTKQVMAGDAYVRDCPGKYRPLVSTDNKSETCPDVLGPDMDFGNAPILRTLPDGRSLIVIGQKDGHAWALDPDKQGAVVWSRQVGFGLDNGGGAIMWGSAADDRLAYFPVTRAREPLGVAALRLQDGELAWRASPPEGGGAPVTVIPGVLFFGSSAGTVFAYSTTDGKALWQFDTARAFQTVNGVAGERRDHQRGRPRRRGRNALRAVGLLRSRHRRPRKRPAGVRAGGSLDAGCEIAGGLR